MVIELVLFITTPIIFYHFRTKMSTIGKVFLLFLTYFVPIAVKLGKKGDLFVAYGNVIFPET